MGIFDKLKSTAKQAVNTAANTAAQAIGSKRETFTFPALPESLAEMQALPEASMDTPFKTAALTVLALCAYAADIADINACIQLHQPFRQIAAQPRRTIGQRHDDHGAPPFP